MARATLSSPVAVLVLGDGEDAIHGWDGEGAENDGVHAAEDGGIGSDADGQGKDRGDGEARGFEKLADGVAQVGPEAFEAQRGIGRGDALAG